MPKPQGGNDGPRPFVDLPFSQADAQRFSRAHVKRAGQALLPIMPMNRLTDSAAGDLNVPQNAVWLLQTLMICSISSTGEGHAPVSQRTMRQGPLAHAPTR